MQHFSVVKFADPFLSSIECFYFEIDPLQIILELFFLFRRHVTVEHKSLQYQFSFGLTDVLVHESLLNWIYSCNIFIYSLSWF